MACFCGNTIEFEHCCKPIILGNKLALTAEELMRARYSAYATNKCHYLVQSTHALVRKNHKIADIKAWAIENKWLKLTIVFTHEGQQNDQIGEVEFLAYFLDKKGNPQVHHEYSTFEKVNGIWYYLSAKFD
jgi:SEC-C motif domain protein